MQVETSSFCRFCIALCGVRVTTDGSEVVSVKGDPEHPGSRGYTCPKGRALGRWHHHPDRILSPRVRHGSRWQETLWGDALDDVSRRIADTVERHGVDSVGVYLGTAASLDAAGKWAGEQFVRAIGTRSKYSAMSIDTPCKPLVSLLMSGTPNLVPVVDDQRCTLTVFLGCNPVVSHGHLNGFPDPVVRMRGLAASPRELWVIDHRITETARLATRTLTPRPGTDFAIVAHLIRELLLGGGCDHQYLAAHSDWVDVATLGELVDEFTAERVSALTGCAADDLAELLAAVRRHGKVSFQTGTGTTMAATANLTEWLVWALHVVTGSYDAPGGMWFSPGFLRQLHTDAEPVHTTPVSAPGPRSRPDLPIWGDEFPCSALADEVEAGNLRVLIVLGGNPASAFPNSERTRRALDALETLVVLDVIDTDTTALATHVLPTTGQLERADMPYYYDQFSLDLSTQYTPAVVAPVGQSRAMWQIVASVAERLGRPILPAPLSTDSSDTDVLRMLASRSPAPFDEIVGERYVASAPVFGWVRDRVLPNGRWRLVPTELAGQLAGWPGLVPPPGLLATSRRQVRRLNSQHPSSRGPSDDASAVLHPETAARLGIRDGDPVVVSSETGSMRTTATLDADQHPDSVSVPHGWSEANVSSLTSEVHVDPLTGMVAQTAVPVRVRRDTV